MKFWTILKVALRALTRNKLRSALTLLGMVIGVGAVIAMVSLGQGAQKMVQDQIESVGTNLLYRYSGQQEYRRRATGRRSHAHAHRRRHRRHRTGSSRVVAATPIVNSRSQLIFGNQNWQTQLVGHQRERAQGSQLDARQRRVLQRRRCARRRPRDRAGKDGGRQPLPGNRSHRADHSREESPLSRDRRAHAQRADPPWDRIRTISSVIPYTTAMKKMRKSALLWIDNAMVVTDSPLASRVAEGEITDLLRQRHNLRADDADDFQVRNLTDIAAAAEQTTLILTLFLGSIAAVSLIVGGIGIMNIMLVSVTERTREIGIRMAIGARSSQIKHAVPDRVRRVESHGRHHWDHARRRAGGGRFPTC